MLLSQEAIRYLKHLCQRGYFPNPCLSIIIYELQQAGLVTTGDDDTFEVTDAGLESLCCALKPSIVEAPYNTIQKGS